MADVEGNVRIDNTLELFDRSSGTPVKVGTLFATFPLGANSANSPSLTLRNETSPIPSNGFGDIILESSDQLFFNTNTSTRMHIGASGNVGIGTTAPGDLFHVNGDAIIGGGSSGDASAEFMSIRAQSDIWYLGVQNEGSQAASDFFIGKSSLEDGTFHITNSGNVGIGTTSPAQPLHVEGDAVIGGGANGDSNSEFLNVRGESDTWFLAVRNENTVAASDFFIGKTSTEDGIFHIRNNTNVGIGTSAPTARLHVSGGVQGVELLLEADTNDVGEDDQPKLTLSQDGGAVTGELGYYNSTNDLRIINQFGGASIILKANGDIIIGN